MQNTETCKKTYFRTKNIKTKNKEFKNVRIKNGACYYFDDIIKFEDLIWITF